MCHRVGEVWRAGAGGDLALLEPGPLRDVSCVGRVLSGPDFASGMIDFLHWYSIQDGVTLVAVAQVRAIKKGSIRATTSTCLLFPAIDGGVFAETPALSMKAGRVTNGKGEGVAIVQHMETDVLGPSYKPDGVALKVAQGVDATLVVALLSEVASNFIAVKVGGPGGNAAF